MEIVDDQHHGSGLLGELGEDRLDERAAVERGGRGPGPGPGRGAERLTLGEGALRVTKPIHTRPLPPPGEPWVAAVSRSHGDSKTEAFIDARPGASRAKLGSALKFGHVAEGGADIYPRLAPTSEWDIAAGHAVVTAAGGKVTDAHGADLKFGERREGFIVPEFIAWGDPGAAGST